MQKDSKKLKDKIMNMPAWKAFVIVLMIIFGIGVVAESLFIHTVFHVLHRAVSAFAKIDKEDKADMDEMSQNEQNDNCFEYQNVMRTKLMEEADNKYHLSSSDYDHDLAINKEERLNSASKAHLFNLAACQQKLEKEGTLEKIRIEAEQIASKIADDIQHQNCDKYNKLYESKMTLSLLNKIHDGHALFTGINEMWLIEDEEYLKKQSEQHLFDADRCNKESLMNGTTEKINKAVADRINEEKQSVQDNNCMKFENALRNGRYDPNDTFFDNEEMEEEIKHHRFDVAACRRELKNKKEHSV